MHILCLIGLHKWRYFSNGGGRQCQRRDCYQWEYRVEGMPWIKDVLGSGTPRDPSRPWDDQEVKS